MGTCVVVFSSPSPFFSSPSSITFTPPELPSLSPPFSFTASLTASFVSETLEKEKKKQRERKRAFSIGSGSTFFVTILEPLVLHSALVRGRHSLNSLRVGERKRERVLSSRENLARVGYRVRWFKVKKCCHS